MSLRPGINNNLQFVKGVASDKGIRFYFTPVVTKSTSRFGGRRQHSSNTEDSWITFWGIRTPKEVTPGTEEYEKAQNRQLLRLDGAINMVKHIYENYITDEDADSIITDKAVLDGLDFEFEADGSVKGDIDDKLKVVLMKESLIEKINKNLAKIVTALDAVATNKDQAIRVKLLLESQNKPYLGFPEPNSEGCYDYNRGSGFIELMGVPQENSALRFTYYELGLEEVKDANGKALKDANGKSVTKKSERGWNRTVLPGEDTTAPAGEGSPAKVFGNEAEEV